MLRPPPSPPGSEPGEPCADPTRIAARAVRADPARTRDPAALHPAAAAHTRLPAGHAEGFADTFRELYRAVYAAVAAGGPPAEPDYLTFADGHEEALIGEAVARSAAEGRWVTVAEELDRV